MSEHIEAQQAAAERLGALGLNATLMVHFPSKIKAPEGILLTTYDQLHSQIAKQETTAYAFPSFGAAQSAMRTLATMQQTVIFIYECHANTGPVEIAAKFLTLAIGILQPFEKSSSSLEPSDIKNILLYYI